MKLASLVLALIVALPSLAGADILNPPGGPVYDDTQAEVETLPARNPGGDRAGGPRQRDPQKMLMNRAKRQRLRHALIEQFDANGDGRLGPRERMRAARTLRRIEQRLVTPRQGAGAGGGQYRRFMRRHDRNGDGQVGPREVPRGAADRLRRFDRDGDGWVEPKELR